MIEPKEIEKVYEIIDREIALIELKEIPYGKKRKIIDRWSFVRDTFQKVCREYAVTQGLM